MLQTGILLIGFILSSVGWQNDEELRLISGLRERRLFQLAEQHCQRLLARPQLTPTESATLSIELIKTQTARALVASGTSRESAWQAVHQTVARTIEQHAGHPRLILMQVQAALAHVSRGQLLRQEIIAEMAGSTDRDDALQELQLANSKLNDIQREIQKQIPQQRNRSLSEHELTSEELLKLNSQVRLQLAIANLNRAQLFGPDDRLNRIDVLAEVLERLREVQRETAPNQLLWWEACTLQVECYRVLKKFAEGISYSQTVLEIAQEQPNLQLDRWLEQQLLLALDVADEKASIQFLQAAESLTNRSPQLDLARLATAIEFSQLGLPPGNVEWLNRAAQVARNVEANHGSYWGRRAKLILIAGGTLPNRSVDSAGHSSSTELAGEDASAAELDLLIGLAEQAERQGRIEDAVKAYDRASATAKKLAAESQAFSLAVKAAQAIEKQNRNLEAANRLIDLANQNREYSLASAAHLRGCWNWGRLLTAGATAPSGTGGVPALPQNLDVQTRYLELLEEHLQSWPQAETANQVRMWLGGQRQTSAKSAEQWEQAFQTFASVAPSSERFGSAMIQAGYCARQWIGGTEASRQRVTAAQVFQRLSSLADASVTDSINQRQAQLIATEIGLRYAVVEPQTFLAPLRRIVQFDQAGNPAEETLRRQGAALMFAIESFHPSFDATNSGLLNLISSEKKWLAQADQAIALILANGGEGASESVGGARVAIAETALAKFGNQMESPERTAWLYRKADGLIDVGKGTESLEILQSLEQELPNDAGVKLRIARLLTRQETDPAKPLARWRQLASQLKPQSEGWFEAKYNVAVLMDKSGESAEARKMLQYMQAIPPGWENSHLRDEFNKLLQRLR